MHFDNTNYIFPKKFKDIFLTNHKSNLFQPFAVEKRVLCCLAMKMNVKLDLAVGYIRSNGGSG